MFSLFFILTIVGCGIGFFIQGWFLRYLRRDHKAIWTDLGRPALFSNSSASTNTKILKFIWGKQNGNGSGKLQKIKINLRIFQLLYGLIFILTVVMFFLR